MEAHYAGAVPIELLKNEQDRIATAIKNIDQQTLASTSHFDNIENNLTIALDLLEHCGDAYKHAPEHIKRQFNQALFAKILIVGDDEAPGGMWLTAEYRAPFDSLITAMHLAPEQRSESDAAEPAETKKGRDLSVPTLSD